MLSLAALAAVVGAHAQVQGLPYVTGLSSPVAMIQDPTRPNTQYIVQRGGLIRVVENGVLRPTEMLNITSLTTTTGERGLLGLALSPTYPSDGFAYIYYTDLSGDIQIRRYTRSTTDPFVLNPSTALNVLRIPHPGQSNHYGGTLAFGPDNLLYIGTGDGGSGGDPPNNAQNPNVLLGKMLRIDPSGDDFPADPNRNYAIPATNPFLDGVPIAAAGEIWSFGLRNPWKWSFDMPSLGGNGGLIIGDVGQDSWEEVDYEPANVGGRNYGWRVREGAHNTGLGGLAYSPTRDPVYEYFHTGGAGMSIVGGYVYRGTGLGASFAGRYFFGDTIIPKVWSLRFTYDGSGEATASDVQDHTTQLGATAVGIPSSFAIDSFGDVYVVSLSGRISLIASTTRNLAGQVTFGNYVGPVPGPQVTIQVRQPGSTTAIDTYNPTLTGTGAYSIPITRIGAYDVSIKASHWLRKTVPYVGFGSGGASGVNVTLINGDVNGDNTISLADFSALRSAFGSTPASPNWNPNADLNGDGTVSLADFSILRTNFGQTGDN